MEGKYYLRLPRSIFNNASVAVRTVYNRRVAAVTLYQHQTRVEELAQLNH